MGTKLGLEDFHAEEYQAGIGVAKVISFLGWLVTAFGAIALAFSIRGTSEIDQLVAVGQGDVSSIAALAFVKTIIGGLLIVVSGHASRAIMNGANDAKRTRILTKRIFDEVDSNQP
jgi:uncharacterized membrane protein YidH (DUF202 family)